MSASPGVEQVGDIVGKGKGSGVDQHDSGLEHGGPGGVPVFDKVLGLECFGILFSFHKTLTF